MQQLKRKKPEHTQQQTDPQQRQYEPNTNTNSNAITNDKSQT